MHRPMLPVAAVMTLALAACASDDPALRENLQAVVSEEDPGPDRAPEEIPSEPVELVGELIDPEGSAVGRFWFREAENGTEIEVEVSGLTQGFHPMYLADVGLCETESRSPGDPGAVGPFLSAGGVVQELPSVLVLADGVGSTTSLVGPVELEELLAGNGTALVVTEAAESLSEIPPVPAAPVDPAEEPPVVDDVGSRVACGAVGGETA